jgi:hypothetical protein
MRKAILPVAMAAFALLFTSAAPVSAADGKGVQKIAAKKKNEKKGKKGGKGGKDSKKSADQAASLDKNKDGSVTREEFNAAMEARFKKMDTNGDGKVNKDDKAADKKDASKDKAKK